MADGSAFLNLFLSGCRSRLGRDLTNRSVCTGMWVSRRRSGGGPRPWGARRDLRSRSRWC